MPMHRENTWIQKVFGVWFETEEFYTQAPAEGSHYGGDLCACSSQIDDLQRSSKNTHFSSTLNPLWCERERMLGKGRGF